MPWCTLKHGHPLITLPDTPPPQQLHACCLILRDLHVKVHHSLHAIFLMWKNKHTLPMISPIGRCHPTSIPEQIEKEGSCQYHLPKAFQIFSDCILCHRTETSRLKDSPQPKNPSWKCWTYNPSWHDQQLVDGPLWVWGPLGTIVTNSDDLRKLQKVEGFSETIVNSLSFCKGEGGEKRNEKNNNKTFDGDRPWSRQSFFRILRLPNF